MRVRRCIAASLLVVPLAVGSAGAAEPSGGDLGPDEPSTSWSGGGFAAARSVPGDAGCLGNRDPGCDHFALKITVAEQSNVEIIVTPDDPNDDLDLHVFDESGARIGGGDGYDPDHGGRERAVVVDVAPGTYTVSVQPFTLYAAGNYHATASLVGPSEPTRYTHYQGVVDALQPYLSPPSIEPRCRDLTPDVVEHVLRPDERVNADVLLLLDGIAIDAARDIAAVASTSYAEVGVDVRWSYDASFSGHSSDDSLLAEARAHVGGVRPPGFEGVVVLTDKELGATQGVADCLGGVRFPDRGFALVEAWHENPPALLGVQHHENAYVLAHELGHILGAHHEYGNCTYGAADGTDFPTDETCTLMLYAPDSHLTTGSLHFSRLNAAVVHTMTLRYAS